MSLFPTTSAAPIYNKDVVIGSIELDSVESTLESFKNGEFVVVVDDLDRENEGDLIIAASQLTPAKMAWIIKHSS